VVLSAWLAPAQRITATDYVALTQRVAPACLASSVVT
jgi:hypothetical protein